MKLTAKKRGWTLTLTSHLYATTVQTSYKLEGSRVTYALDTRFAGVPFRSFDEAHDNARVANEKYLMSNACAFSFARCTIAQTRYRGDEPVV